MISEFFQPITERSKSETKAVPDFFRRSIENRSIPLIIIMNLSITSPYGHLSNTDTSLLRTVPLVPTKCPYIFYKENLYNTNPL